MIIVRQIYDIHKHRSIEAWKYCFSLCELLKIVEANSVKMPFADPFFPEFTAAAAMAKSHTQDYRMLNKYIIWLYSARVRMFFWDLFSQTPSSLTRSLYLTLFSFPFAVTYRLLFIFCRWNIARVSLSGHERHFFILRAVYTHKFTSFQA